MCVNFHVYIQAVELKLVQDLEIFVLETGPRVVLKTGPRFLLFSHFYSVLRACLINTNGVSLCRNSVFAKLSGCQK